MRLMNIVEDLEGLGNERRKNYILEVLDEQGIDYKKMSYNNYENIIVSFDREKEIGIASHFDAVPGSPGANDNASAVAVTLDILRKFRENPLTNIGVRGMFFDGEESGLVGSRNYVRSEGLDGLIGVYNMELVGMGDRLAFWTDQELYAGLLLKTIEEQARIKSIETYRFPQISRFLYNSGDQVSFNEAGMKEAFCITAISGEDVQIAVQYFTGTYSKEQLMDITSQAPLFKHYHQPTDRSEYLREECLQMVSGLLWDCVYEIDRNFSPLTSPVKTN